MLDHRPTTPTWTRREALVYSLRFRFGNEVFPNPALPSDAALPCPRPVSLNCICFSMFGKPRSMRRAFLRRGGGLPFYQENLPHASREQLDVVVFMEKGR
jgi:hypothetical protein